MIRRSTLGGDCRSNSSGVEISAYEKRVPCQKHGIGFVANSGGLLIGASRGYIAIGCVLPLKSGASASAYRGESPEKENFHLRRVQQNARKIFLMSHVENAEPNNGSGCANDTATNDHDKSIAGLRSENSVDEKIQVIPKTSQLDNDTESTAHPKTDDITEKNPDTKSQNKDDACVATGDICRICHIGEYVSVADNHSSCNLQDQYNQTTSSNFSYLGSLISACKCRGTVALVHVECLERWLTESGRERCELCGHKYKTKRVPRYSLFRSILIWFHTVIATRQMLLDIGYLVMTTPVAAFSCYVCALALKMMLRNGSYEIPWMIVAMLPTCLLTLIAYWRWIITLGRLHGHRWRRYWQNNFVVRLIPDNDRGEDAPRPSSDRFDAHEDFERWGIEEMDELA